MLKCCRIREIFELVDTDKGGSIASEELKSLAESVGLYLEKEQLADWMTQMDTDGSGEIEYFFLTISYKYF